MYSSAINITYRGSPSWISLTYDMGLRLLTSEIEIVVAITNSFKLITNAKKTCKRLIYYLFHFYIVIFDSILSYIFMYWRLGQLYNSNNGLNCSTGYNGDLNDYYFYSQIKKTNNGCIVWDHHEKWWLLSMSKIFLLRVKFE